MKTFFKPSGAACPQGCAYCIVDMNPNRRKEYLESVLYFMNSFVAINIMPERRDQHLEEIRNLDWSLFSGDYLGFQGASEPLMYKRTLFDILGKARQFGFKVAICSKLSIGRRLAKELAEFRDVLDIEISYAKLSELERSDAKRLASIGNALEAGFDVLTVIQPFIYGLTDVRLEELIRELKSVGATYVSVNGFRYSKAMEWWARQVLPHHILQMYRENEGVEYLPDRGQIEARLTAAGFKVTKISKWLRRNESGRYKDPAEVISNMKRLVGFKSQIDPSNPDWRVCDNEHLRVASDSNSEMLAKMFERRMNF